MTDHNQTDHRKSGTVENAADAFHLVGWLARTLCSALEDRFGRAMHVEVRVDVRDVSQDGDADE